MANLDNLEAKIRAESERKAEEILESARDEAEKTVAEAEAAARDEAGKLLSDAKREAERLAARILQGQTLAVRDMALAAKREVLDRVFDEALARLNGMPEPEYRRYLADYLPRVDTDGDELVLPTRYGIGDIEWLNAALKAAGKKGNLTLGEGDADGGFILRKNGVERNHTFSALIAYYRQELEGDALKLLYA